MPPTDTRPAPANPKRKDVPMAQARRHPSHSRGPRFVAVAILALCAWVWPSEARAADEIVVRDLSTGATSSIRAWEVTSETWSEVKYKERERSAEKSVPTITVVEINRPTTDSAANSLANAVADLDRGNYREAAGALQAIGGGGWKINLETGERRYVSFSESDPQGRGKRAPWTSEYAHFYYTKAKYLEGAAANDRAILEEALLAVDDLPVPGAAGQKTGGFLGRFANGNSRFYPEAMAIKANVLVKLARYDEALAAFNDLHNAAIRVPLEPRWAYEGKIGAGVIAEAQGNLTAAVEGYNGAGTTIEVLLREEPRSWVQQEYGRYYSLARMRVAAVKLQDAEKRKAASAFADLRSWIDDGQPEALRRRGMTRGMPPAAVDALVAGARDPAVQAVALNGVGLAFLNEPKPKYEEALMAFRAVVVKYFQVPEQPARALYYLAKAAQGAAKGQKPEVSAMYERMRDEAIKTLRRDYADSPWANRGP